MKSDKPSFNDRRRGKMEDVRKIQRDLSILYNKASAIDRKNWTMKQKRDHSWKVFADIGGGQRPPQTQSFKEHLRRTHKRKKLDKADAQCERKTGEFDLLRGSALKKQRKGRMDRRHETEKRLRANSQRIGNPHALYSTGKMDFKTQELQVSSKIPRHIKRMEAHKQRMVKEAAAVAKSSKLFR